MNARNIFVTHTGVLHPLWRLAAFMGLVILSVIASVSIAGPLITGLFALIGVRGVSNESWVTAIGLLAATAISVRMIDKRPWSDVWLDRAAARPRAFGFGFLLGAACIGIPTAVLALTGWLGREPGGAGSWWGALVRTTLILVPAAFTEELATRGYILSVLREWWGWGWAIAVTSLGFGLLHVRNPGATPASVALVTIAGFFLASIVYATRSLYAASAAHVGWNWMMAVVFHVSVSGYPFESPGYRYVDAGPDWATGGGWGPEGGIPAVLGMLGGMALMIRRRRRDKSTDNGLGERIDG